MNGPKEHQYLPSLRAQFAEGRIDRREFLRSATLLGLSAAAAYAFVTETRPASAASSGPSDQGPMPRGGTLTLGMPLRDISSPHTYSLDGQHNVTRNVCEYLTKTGHDNVTRPCLLERWEASDDLMSWTLHLRPDVAWHNGRPFTSDDVLWNLKRVLDPATGSSMLGLMKGYMLDESDDNGVVKTHLWDANAIEKLDDHRVRLNCKVPQLAVPEHLFHYPCPILDPEDGGTFGPGANGTGAFSLVAHETGQESVLEARTSYWGDGPHLDRLIFRDFGDEPYAAVEALAARRVLGLHSVDVVQLDAVKLITGVRLYDVPTADTAVVRGKVDRAPFNDPRVRKAMRLAIDPKTTQQITLGTLGLPAEHHHVCPIHPEYAELPVMERDVAKAKTLLAEAGYPDGLDIGTIDCKSSPSWEFNAVQAIVEQWKWAGIRCQINLMPSNAFWEIWDSTALGFTEWAHRPLGVMALGLGYRSGVPWNESGYANPEFDRLLTEAEGILDPEARREIMAQIEAILQEDGPIVQPLWRSVTAAMDEKIRGFHMHPTRYIFGNELAIDA